jgi:hypothetical protein
VQNGFYELDVCASVVHDQDVQETRAKPAKGGLRSAVLGVLRVLKGLKILPNLVVLLVLGS